MDGPIAESGDKINTVDGVVEGPVGVVDRASVVRQVEDVPNIHRHSVDKGSRSRMWRGGGGGFTTLPFFGSTNYGNPSDPCLPGGDVLSAAVVARTAGSFLASRSDLASRGGCSDDCQCEERHLVYSQSISDSC